MSKVLERAAYESSLFLRSIKEKARKIKEGILLD